MTDVLPPPFLFRYSFPVRKIAGLPRRRGALLDLPAECRLRDLNALSDRPTFAELRIAWNEQGLGVSVTVAGKNHAPACDAAQPTEGDGLHVWIDTRNTQSIHRASRFCHQFCFLQTGGGRKANQPLAVQVPIAQAREDAPHVDPAKLSVATKVRKGGYELEAWMPAAALHGFDPDANPRLGFYYLLRDSELGEQPLCVGREFPFAHDPSLWSTLELV